MTTSIFRGHYEASMNNYNLKEFLKHTYPNLLKWSLIYLFSFYSVQGFPSAYAIPQGGVVAAGSASFESTQNNLNIHQASNKVVIDWRSFDIGSTESVEFYQPSAGAIAVNRINDFKPSEIFGSLTANGNVILLNPNGVLFGAGSIIDVNSIIASTANISNEDFMNNDGRMNFDTNLAFIGADGKEIYSNPNASIINDGTITARNSGLVGLVAPNVYNNGVINAKFGKVHLASGDQFALDMYGDGLINIVVNDQVSDHITNQIVSNSGTINADGGIIALTASSGRNIVNSLIEVTGDLNASGGNIDILGSKVIVASGARINTSANNGGGTIRIGGDYQGSGDALRAIQTEIQENTTITADAINNGDGGRVIIWSDDITQFHGKISAQGGELGGNGGLIETSGINTLSVSGTIDASAKFGQAGKWLLDPTNVIIQSVAGTGVVTTASIQTSLNNGTSVDVVTSASGTENGDITVNNAITKTLGGDATLTLKAIGGITIKSGANITSSNGKLNIVLNSRSDGGSSTGSIKITNSTLNSNGGNIILGGGSDPFLEAAQDLGTSGILLSGATLVSDVGDISIRGGLSGNAISNNNAVSISSNSSLTSSDGNINIVGTYSRESGTATSTTPFSGVNVNNSAVKNTESGNINISGSFSANSTNSIGIGITIENGSKISLSSTSTGNINITGTGSSPYSNNNTNGNNYGVLITGSGTEVSSTASTGAGTITINGTGSNSLGNNNFGVNIKTNSLVSTINDDVIINGSGGDGAGNRNYGVRIGSSITSTGSGDITMNSKARSGDINSSSNNSKDTFFSPASSLVGGSGDINLNSADKIIFRSNNTITTSGGVINFDGEIDLSNNLDVDSTNGGANSSGGDVTFSKTVNNNYNLNVTSGTSGKTTFNGIVGGNTALGDLSVTSGGGVDFNSDVTAKTIVADTTSGVGDIKIGLGASLNATVTSGDSIILASSGNFENNSGSTPFSTSGSARYLVYSANPANDILGGIVRGTKRYNKTYSGYDPASVTESGNVFLYSIAPTITVNVNDANKIYGDVNPAFSEAVSGVIDGDNLASLYETGTLTTAADNKSNVGTYTINSDSSLSVSAEDLGYTINYVDGDLQIDQRDLTVTAGNGSRIYGDSNSSTSYASATYDNLVNDDAESLDVHLSNSSLITDNVGTHNGVVSASAQGVGSNNYNINYVVGDLEVIQATLLARADDKTRIFGEKNPEFTTSYSGFKNGDTASSVGIVGTAVTTPAKIDSSAGDYDIDLDVGSATSTNGNYNIVLGSNGGKGTLTINVKPEDIARANEITNSSDKLQLSKNQLSSNKKCIIQFDSLDDDSLLSSSLIDIINKNSGSENYICLKYLAN
ncbi:MAG: filamentous hemagglutinin family protein [Myxococcota bacterium]|jgi:filamentous hemagglutinin family protein